MNTVSKVELKVMAIPLNITCFVITRKVDYFASSIFISFYHNARFVLQSSCKLNLLLERHFCGGNFFLFLFLSWSL